MAEDFEEQNGHKDRKLLDAAVVRPPTASSDAGLLREYGVYGSTVRDPRSENAHVDYGPERRCQRNIVSTLSQLVRCALTIGISHLDSLLLSLLSSQ